MLCTAYGLCSLVAFFHCAYRGPFSLRWPDLIGHALDLGTKETKETTSAMGSSSSRGLNEHEPRIRVVHGPAFS
ncbi:hypothetical protein J2S34_002266 [Nitrobacter winogradskyi]|uniref:Uncharacterized protein n=1 Tax=Nitrobacter winogradskyi TaxID=913 RepID=A0ACC6AK01_NITWI|nr:hypothetical protein [Nitrobacter winogradskyi]